MGSIRYIEGRDARYRAAGMMVKAGEIKAMPGIFEIIPKTRVAADLGIKLDRFNLLIENPGDWKVGKLHDLSLLMGLDDDAMIRLVYAEYARSFQEKPASEQQAYLRWLGRRFTQTSK